jgi:hypothetical protein
MGMGGSVLSSTNIMGVIALNMTFTVTYYLELHIPLSFTIDVIFVK